MKGSKLGSKAMRITAGLAGLGAAAHAHALEWYFQSPGSQLAREIDGLHRDIMWLIIGIFVAVFGAMFWACIYHRKSKGHAAEQFHENTTVELLWTVIPAIILVVIAWPVTKVVIAQKDTSAPDITVKVTGYQWKWGYDYIKGEGEGISFVSMLSTPRDQIENKAPKGEHYLLEVDNEMVVPVGKKIRMITTAADVIHSWWVPAFGAKQDAIPGFLRDLWFKPEITGTFRSQCVELCGKEHGFMPIVVEVRSQEDYTKWVGEQKKLMLAAVEDTNRQWSEADLVKRGEQAFNQHCAVCHQQNGQGVPNTFPPLVGSNVVSGPKGGQIRIVLNGRKGGYRPNTAMLIQLVNLVVQANDLPRAGSLMSSWLAKYPADLSVRLEYANLLMQQQNNPVAIAQFQAVLKQDPTNIVALNNLGWLLQTSDPKRALTLLIEAQKIAPNSADIADTLGWVKVQQKDVASGLALLNKAHASQPQDGEISYHLVVALDAGGQHGPARQLLKTLLASGAKFQDLPAANKLAADWR